MATTAHTKWMKGGEKRKNRNRRLKRRKGKQRKRQNNCFPKNTDLFK
jgi:hypothetical protein